jgi:phosphinothricin acetyltransferase
VIIRDAREADLPAIVAILNAAIATRMATAQLRPVTVEERLPWLRGHTPDGHPLWVLEKDGRVAAWLSVHPFSGRCAYRGTAEVSVYVAEEFRRRGYARALLEQLLERSPALEIHSFLGLIFAHNAPSLALFRQLGFEQWGLLPHVAQMEGLLRDVIIMGRHVAERVISDDEGLSRSAAELPVTEPWLRR